MKTVKRAAAAMLAAVTTTAMAASISPAFAYENQDLAKEEFVQSFNEGIDRKCAQYLIDNGCALDEAMDIMDTYMEGLAMMEEQPMARATTYGHYYSRTGLASTEHFVLVIATTPDCPITSRTKVEVSASNRLISTTADSATLMTAYADNVGYFHSDFSEGEDDSEWYHEFEFRNVSAFESSTARAAVRVGVTPIDSSINTEAKLYNAISLSLNKIGNEIFAYETYAKGDVNHDGLVNEADSTLLLQFLAEQTALDITYADGSNHYSFVTNVAAADFNLDGVVNMADLVRLNEYLA